MSWASAPNVAIAFSAFSEATSTSTMADLFDAGLLRFLAEGCQRLGFDAKNHRPVAREGVDIFDGFVVFLASFTGQLDGQFVDPVLVIHYLEFVFLPHKGLVSILGASLPEVDPQSSTGYPAAGPSPAGDTNTPGVPSGRG